MRHRFQHMGWSIFLFQLIISLFHILPPVARGTGTMPDDVELDSQMPLESHAEAWPTVAEEKYQAAIEIRDDLTASASDLKKAVELLYEAAGIEHLSIEKQARNSNGLGSESNKTTNQIPGDVTSGNYADVSLMSRTNESGDGDGQDTYVTAKNVIIMYRGGIVAHWEAVRELIYIFRAEGEGAPFNPAVAHALLCSLADAGDPEAQAEMAMYLAVGIEPVGPNSAGRVFVLTEPDVPAAIVLYHFAARNGDPLAQISLGYRHLHGIGVPRSCRTAALYYAAAAEQVLQLAQQVDGLPEASNFRVSQSTSPKKPRPNPEQEFLHYQWFADYGHADAARLVAQLLHHQHGNPEAAIGYLQQAADAGDAGAMVHLGHAYANGLVVEQDNATAWRWFWNAAEAGRPGGFFGLGYMHLTGQGAEVDYRQAMQYFKYAIEIGQGWGGIGDALFYLGTMYMKGLHTEVDMNQAKSLFAAAANAGNLLGAYNMAVLKLQEGDGDFTGNECKAAVSYLKTVAERGWSTLAEAADDFSYGDYAWALMNYLKLAESGSEIAQSNAAFMLSEGLGYDGKYAGKMAITLFRRAADQGNNLALVQLGDCYWYGRGTTPDKEQAGSIYAEAAQRKVPQALFNMGFLHQFGIGVPKDLFLAKRYYDDLANGIPDARLAANLALVSLHIYRFYESLRPSLPEAWTKAIDGLIVTLSMGSDSEKSGGNGESRSRSPWRVFEAADIFDALDDNMDSSLLIWLGALLGLILWRRHILRSQRRRPREVVANIRVVTPTQPVLRTGEEPQNEPSLHATAQPSADDRNEARQSPDEIMGVS